MIWTKALAFAGLVAMTCALEPDGAVPMDTPAHYREIWKQAEACSGLTGDFDRVRWNIVLGHDFPCNSGKCIGEWHRPHTITIASDWVTTDWVVRHEILHDLVNSGHWPGDTVLWGVKCHATWGWLESSDPNYRP